MPQVPSGWTDGSVPQLLADGLGGRVWLVRRPNGEPAILKAFSEQAMETMASGIGFLCWRRGHGAVRMLGSAERLCLMEYAGDELLEPLVRSDGDAQATEIAVEVLAKLHAPSPANWPAALIPLEKHFSALDAKARADLKRGDQTIFYFGARVAHDLVNDQRDVRPLHGDFHHENILNGPRGWLAIDPFGLLGDVGYDTANLFYNPLESPLRTDPERVARLAGQLAALTGQDEGRILGWGFAHACLSASWHVEDGNGAEAEKSLEVARAIDQVGRFIP